MPGPSSASWHREMLPKEPKYLAIIPWRNLGLLPGLSVSSRRCPLGHTWEESRVDSRAKIYLQRRNNKLDTFPGRLWACGYEFRSQNERSEDFRRILGGISAQIQDNTVSARGEKLPEANHGQGHLQPGLAAQSPIQCGSGSLQG